MKNRCIIFLLSIIISVMACVVFVGCQSISAVPKHGQTEYLRIHIRADSNDRAAQEVKYAVRDEVVTYLTPLVANYQTQSQALQGISLRLNEVERVANTTLSQHGYNYKARAYVRKEQFPTRVYEGITLPAGEYDALIIELGKGQGDNWWCVVYPPLCFTAPSGVNVIYKSKILEIINRWKIG